MRDLLEKEIYNQYFKKAQRETDFLKKRILSCEKCSLRDMGRNPLPGRGHPLADILVLKESPSLEEVRKNTAFFDAAGKAILQAFEKLNLSYSQIYTTNALKCLAPPDKVRPQNIFACSYHLKWEITITEPKLILVMGNFAQHVLRKISSQAFSTELKQWQSKNFKLRPDITILITHSPEEALKKEKFKKEMWEDLKQLANLYKILRHQIVSNLHKTERDKSSN